jgi:hypothetical protein
VCIQKKLIVVVFILHVNVNYVFPGFLRRRQTRTKFPLSSQHLRKESLNITQFGEEKRQLTVVTTVSKIISRMYLGFFGIGI